MLSTPLQLNRPAQPSAVHIVPASLQSKDVCKTQASVPSWRTSEMLQLLLLLLPLLLLLLPLLLMLLLITYASVAPPRRLTCQGAAAASLRAAAPPPPRLRAT